MRVRRIGPGVARVSLALAMFAGGAPAWGQHSSEGSREDIPPGWRFEIQPYLWLPVAISGHSRVGEQEVPIDLSFGDVFEKLQMTAQLRFEAWYERFGISLDTVYNRLRHEGTRGAEAFEVETRAFLGDLTGAFRLGPMHAGFENSSVGIDLVAGGRLIAFEQDLDLAATSRSASETIVLGLVGARGFMHLSHSWLIGVRLLAAYPDVEWSVGGGAEYLIGRVALRLGYRYDRLLRHTHETEIEASAHGPFVAVGVGFGSGPIF